MSNFSLKANGFELVCEDIKPNEFKSILSKISEMDFSLSNVPKQTNVQATRQINFPSDSSPLKKRLPNLDVKTNEIKEVEQIKEKPIMLEKSSKFKCPSCKQMFLIEDNNIYLYYSYSQKKLFSIDKKNINLQVIIDEKDNKKLIDSIELLIEKSKEDEALKELIYTVNIIKDDSVFYNCSSCGTKSSLTELIPKEEVDYDQCVICSSEIESQISNTGQKIKCSNKECNFDYTKISINEWREN